MKPTIQLQTHGRPWRPCRRPGMDSARSRWMVGFTSSAEGPLLAGRSATSTRCSRPDPHPLQPPERFGKIPASQSCVAGHDEVRHHPRRTGNQRPARLRECHRSEEHTSELQSLAYLVCRLLLEKKKKKSKFEPI